MGTKTGRWGEEQASQYLVTKGFEILKRNFKAPRGEVDIIVRKGEILVFVEVKTYLATSSASLEWSVDGKKRRRITETARYFLAKNPEYDSCFVRFDVIQVSGDGMTPVHFENAFTESGVS